MPSGNFMTLAEEKALLAEAKHDPEAFGRVYDRYFDAIFRYVLNRVAQVSLAEDLTAQTFFKAMRNLWKFRWTGVSISAWLYRIATNEVNAHLRMVGTRPLKSLASVVDQLEDPRSPPDLELIAAEEALARYRGFLLLHEAVRTLKPEDQSLIVLRYFEGKSFHEIARIINRREGCLRMRTLRALEKLRTMLEKWGVDHEKIAGCVDAPPDTRSEYERLQAKLTLKPS
jgi:RNA polymerase sigma-70 factor (ECF subfamily)